MRRYLFIENGKTKADQNLVIDGNLSVLGDVAIALADLADVTITDAQLQDVLTKVSDGWANTNITEHSVDGGGFL